MPAILAVLFPGPCFVGLEGEGAISRHRDKMAGQFQRRLMRGGEAAAHQARMENVQPESGADAFPPNGLAGTETSDLAAFQRFARHLPGAWWVKDAAGVYLYVNEAAEANLGLPHGAILGHTDLELLPKGAAEALRANDQQVLRTGENLEVLEHLSAPPAETRSWFSARVRLPVGRGYGIAGFAIEVTEQARASHDAERLLQQVLDAITDMVLVKGPQSRLQWANKAFLATYGMTNEQLKGLIDAPFIEPDLTQQYVRDDLHVFTTGLSIDIPEEAMVRHDGKVLTCHTVKSPIFDDHGKVIKMVAVIRDITERKRLELELQQAQKLESVGRLASGIAHEINTPIQFVGDHARFIRSAVDDLLSLCQKYQAFVAKSAEGAVSADDIATIRQAEEDADLDFAVKNIPAAMDSVLYGTTRVADLVRAMKEFGHPDLGERQETDINRALENTVMISANEVKYVADLEMNLGVLPDVSCIASELSQVFLNLLVNAAHSIGDVVAGTDKRGKITITTRPVENDVVVSIADTGTGIPEALQSKIFDAFFTTKGVGKGTGQGLAIARMIVVGKHRGTLTFDTKAGCGTTFHVRIPVNAP